MPSAAESVVTPASTTPAGQVPVDEFGLAEL
jgi:hypothetical protein